MKGLFAKRLKRTRNRIQFELRAQPQQFKPPGGQSTTIRTMLSQSKVSYEKKSSTTPHATPPHPQIEQRKMIPKTRRKTRLGDIVTINMSLTPENGYVPLSLFDTSGILTLTLGGGNYLPGLHTLLEGMLVGDAIHNVSIDAGWGEHNPDMVVRVAKKKLKTMKDLNLIEVGSRLYLNGDVSVVVTEVSEDSIVVDGNLPLAGASFSCDLKVLDIQSPPPLTFLSEPTEKKHRFHVATFALGCFWGGELAFMRIVGVVGTTVGYTQGHTKDPTYEEVCTGETHHREAIMVVYDPAVVSYSDMIDVAKERMEAETKDLGLYRMFNEDEDDGPTTKQYRHGVYYHSSEQMAIAKQEFTEGSKYLAEVKRARVFHDAEDYHQQYLLKGGQSARKGSKETIRCFG